MSGSIWMFSDQIDDEDMCHKIQRKLYIPVLSQACTMQTVCSICWTFFCREARMKNNNYSTERK